MTSAAKLASSVSPASSSPWYERLLPQRPRALVGFALIAGADVLTRVAPWVAGDYILCGPDGMARMTSLDSHQYHPVAGHGLQVSNFYYDQILGAATGALPCQAVRCSACFANRSDVDSFEVSSGPTVIDVAPEDSLFAQCIRGAISAHQAENTRKFTIFGVVVVGLAAAAGAIYCVVRRQGGSCPRRAAVGSDAYQALADPPRAARG